MMNELIRKQDAIKEICEDIEWLESQGCTEIPLAERKERDVDIIKNLPSASDKLIQIIEEGIKATGTADEYSVGMCNGMKWCKSLLDGKEPKYDTVQSSDIKPTLMRSECASTMPLTCIATTTQTGLPSWGADMEELIKSIVQSEGYAEAIRKGYVVRTWKSYKDGHGEGVNVRMISDHYATETFFGVKANRNFVKDRVMYLYQSVVNYYNDVFE